MIFLLLAAIAPITDTASVIELNTTIDGAGEPLFTQILVWNGAELIYVHYWGADKKGNQFGHIASDRPGEIEVHLNSLDGPRIVTAAKLIRTRTREPRELTEARNSPRGRVRRGLSKRE